MAAWLRQSTAVNVLMGPFISSADGVTALGALSITQGDCLLQKNGGGVAAKNDGSSATHQTWGWYLVPLNATDTNTLGPLLLFIPEAGAIQVWREFMVVPQQVYDSLVAGTDNLQVDTIQAAGTAWNSGAIGAATLAADTITAAKIAADAIGASELAADAVNEIADGVLDRANGVETGLTFRQWLRLAASALFGKASGLDTTTAIYRDVNDTKDRITATVDVNGNRSAVTRDAT
ncbi:MAG: hypothetical protein GEU95_01250 [Rhizobiales bacterium]|nr:hypothetical protein [Hyphomicrobiales bacterium]